MVYVRVLTVPPIALGAWSMALVLWQPPEYYYYCTSKELYLLRYNGTLATKLPKVGQFSLSTVEGYTVIIPQSAGHGL